MNKCRDNSKFVFDPRIVFIIEDDIFEVGQVIVWVDEQTVDCKRLYVSDKIMLFLVEWIIGKEVSLIIFEELFAFISLVSLQPLATY